MKNKRPRPFHKFLFKASWNGTAFKFWIDAYDMVQARKIAERQVFKMEGGRTCLEIELLRVQ